LSNGLKAGEVDMVPELMASALAIAARILFSVDVTSTEGKVVAVALTSVMDSVAERMNSPFPMPPAIPTGPNRRMKKAVRELDNIVYKFIAERRADSSKSEDLLTALLAARTEDGQGMTDEQIRDEAMTAFLAGFETSSLTMAWVVWLLAKYPEEQEKVRAALLSTFGDRPLGAADSKGLKPVDNVICEAMRLYPPIILVGRQADQDIELGGFRIPKGTAIWPCQWVLHRDPRYWSDPEKFVPDRWNEDLFKKTPKFAYFPFSGGPHHCVGNNIAMLEMNIVLGTLLRKWRFEPIAGKDPIPLPGFTLRPGPGVPLKLTPVKPAHSAVA
jgi:cytochrome P450